ncbi:MAG: hypothetical protein JWL58_4131 [Streptosporangiaceae bacterium]|jgi:hypothetical protein|nr:hypothetical protein [Streptosporangiaceae bacterium]
MEPDERVLLVKTLRQLAEAFDGAELTRALDGFGFADLLAQSPHEAVSSLFTAMGRAGSTSAALQDVLALPLAGVAHEGAAGHSIVLPHIGAPLAGTFEDETLTLRGLVLGRRPSGAFLAPVGSEEGVVWVRPADQKALSCRVVAGLDSALAITEVTTTGGRAEVVLAGEAAAESWHSVVAAGRRALGYQIVGAAGRMIELAVDHARDRVQFGHPIGSFQAVRHRLADAFVAREGAAAALELAWEAEDEQLAGMLAKSLAGRAARIAATQCQQVLAGVGFTAEHSFHRFLVRATVLDAVLGSAGELPRAIGARLVSTGAIPRLVQL